MICKKANPPNRVGHLPQHSNAYCINYTEQEKAPSQALPFIFIFWQMWFFLENPSLG